MDYISIDIPNEPEGSNRTFMLALPTVLWIIRIVINRCFFNLPATEDMVTYIHFGHLPIHLNVYGEIWLDLLTVILMQYQMGRIDVLLKQLVLWYVAERGYQNVVQHQIPVTQDIHNDLMETTDHV